MRVLQVLGSSAGGVGRHVGQVASALRAEGHEVVVAGPRTVRALVGDDAPFEDVEIADRPRAGDVAAVRRLAALGRDADVVHAHGLRAGALAVLAARGLRRAPAAGRRPRVVVTLHNLPVGGRAVRGVSAVLERVVGRGADVVLGVSPDLVALATARGARRTGLALVPAPSAAAVVLDPEVVRRTRDALGLAPDERLVVTVARLAPQKGLDVLAAAARELRGTVTTPWRWVVAGEGPLRAELEAGVRAFGVPVELLGWRDDAGTLLAAADVVVSTARWEGQPLWLQEALAHGAAIVATDVGGTRAVTGDGARLVPAEAADGVAGAVAAAVSALLSDDDARDALRRLARERAALLPTGRDVVEQLEAVYQGRPGSA